MMGKRRPNKGGRVVVPQVGSEGFQVIVAGPPINYMPFPEKYTPVTLTPADDVQVIVAGPGIPWDERKAWRKHKPKGVPVIDPELDGPPADEASEPEPTNNTLPTEEEIATLPRWARVAFAARCARRVLPFIPTFGMGHDRLVAVFETVNRLVETSATEGRPLTERELSRCEEAFYAAKSFTRTFGIHDERAGAAGFLVTIGVAQGNTSVLYAKKATDDSPEVGQGLIRDFTTLTRLAALHGWTDDTPVPPTVFGPLWPEGTPPGWPEDDQPDRELTFEIDIPDEATDADVKRYVELLVRKADDLYRAGGGNGLKISGIEVTGDAVPKTDPTPTEAPTVAGGVG